MEEEANKDTIDKQEDNFYIFDDGAKAPLNRMQAIWEVKGLLAEEPEDEDETPEAYRYRNVNSGDPDSVSLLLGSSNKTQDTNVAIAAMYMARGLQWDKKFLIPSDREMFDIWDEAE